MSKFFKVFGVVSACIFVLLIFGLIYLFSGSGALDKESRMFADNIVETNVKGWKQPIDYDLLSTEFKKTVTPAEFMILWDKLSRIGEASFISDALGEAQVHYLIGGDKTVTASYRYEAQFKNCEAEILLNLVQESEKWKVKEFRFSSKNNVSCL